MNRANVDGTTLEYQVQGYGEPVVCIHGALFESFGALAADHALKDRFKLIRYCRRGYGGSKADATVPISRQAADCLGLLRTLEAAPAHVVGHSSGGAIAIQLALDAPEAVRSLTLLEPALLDVPSGPQLFESLAPALDAYAAGDKRGATDAFMRAACGEEYRTIIDRNLPGALEQAVADADAFFAGEFPALGEWTFTREDARRIKQPVLAVLGGESHDGWPNLVEGHQRLLEWLPQAQAFVLPRANHMLQVQNPHDMAAALADFLERNRGN